MDKPLLTLHPLRRMLKSHGAPRVAEKAADALARSLEQDGLAIVQEAHKLATHANRKTVMKQDIKMAAKILQKP
ncbi:MAG: NFYB/HAP3 family transcription factor subunit [Candidatus Aenigmarchaeota archaeon]|nr:NFYB/HAP3 family transcription factor subunit [Candidatus Aenigmarchaeota archaeon]